MRFVLGCKLYIVLICSQEGKYRLVQFTLDLGGGAVEEVRNPTPCVSCQSVGEGSADRVSKGKRQ